MSRAATLATGLLLAAQPAGAFSAFDGKIELHGYFSEQIRALANDLNPDEEFDLAQWYNCLLYTSPSPRDS